VIAALKAAGIADRDIQTSNLSISPRYADTNSSALPPVVGYEASNQVEVKQRKVAEFGKVIDALVAAGANQVNGPTFSLDDGDAAADEAR
ncbi:SIMPL domain-containing protein, partial [Salmonella enterica]|uniref:SIMPL domain-containing protein n=1 Tax=Salmonella enterica TaxID=28901 RepID=UPI003D29D92B